MIRIILSLLACLALVSGSPVALRAAAPQPNEPPETCPWCEDDPEILGRLAAVSHGPFAIARTDTRTFPESFPAAQWIFLETPHLRLASSLGPLKLTIKERKRIAPDLDRLRKVLPKLPKKLKVLDPWLRVHLLALKSEDFYARFQKLLAVTDEDFPATRDYDKPFMGDGAYLGEKDKFEIIWHASRRTHQMFTKSVMGGTPTDALRWHLSPEHKLLASIPAEDGDLRENKWLLPHSVHLMSHLFLCAYKHFSFDPPIWLDEGLAHVLEREVNPLSTTIDGDEGSEANRGGHQDWFKEEARLAKSSKAPNFAAMLRWNAFHDLNGDAHRAAWSRVRFLVLEHPEKFATFVDRIKGQLDEAGYPDGKDLVGLQRKLLKELWGWTPADFDEAWKLWALAQ